MYYTMIVMTSAVALTLTLRRALSVTEKGDSASTEGFKAEGTKGQRFYGFHYDYKDSIATRKNMMLIRP